MNTVITIIIIAVIVGMASAGWLMLIIKSKSKKVSDKAVLKRWLKMQGLLFIALMFSCSPGQLVGTGYMVSVKQEGKTEVLKVNTRAEADSIYNALVYPEPLGRHDPFYEFRNSETFIYIEKKGIYEKKGKTKWRVYDEKLKK
jgi:hypothetical protein